MVLFFWLYRKLNADKHSPALSARSTKRRIANVRFTVTAVKMYKKAKFFLLNTSIVTGDYIVYNFVKM